MDLIISYNGVYKMKEEKESKMGGRLGGVCKDRLDQFRPTKEYGAGLEGRMSWEGENNGRGENTRAMAPVAKKY